jgi:hypothetical protein
MEVDLQGTLLGSRILCWEANRFPYRNRAGAIAAPAHGRV